MSKASAIKRQPRIFIYTKDVEIITGRGYRTACRLLDQIRKANGKPKYAYVTIREFCVYMNADEELVMSVISI